MLLNKLLKTSLEPNARRMEVLKSLTLWYCIVFSSMFEGIQHRLHQQTFFVNEERTVGHPK